MATKYYTSDYFFLLYKFLDIANIQMRMCSVYSKPQSSSFMEHYEGPMSKKYV